MSQLSPAANDISLIVINDGDGSQCGMTYPQRCAAAHFGIAEFRAACQKANNWRVKHECESATKADILAAASEVQEYYRNHLAENSRMAKQQ